MDAEMELTIVVHTHCGNCHVRLDGVFYKEYGKEKQLFPVLLAEENPKQREVVVPCPNCKYNVKINLDKLRQVVAYTK